MDGLRGNSRSWGGMSDNDGLRGSNRGWNSTDSDGLRGGSEWLNSGTSSSWSSRDNWKSGMMSGGDYERSSYGSSRSYLESYPSRNERFGPYESHDSRSALDGRDLYRSGYDLHEPGRSRFGDSYPDRSESSYRNFGDQYLDPYEGRSQSRLYDNGRSNWDDTYTHSSSMPRVWADSDTGRGSYSSYSSFSTLLSKPSSVGSRGRGMLAYSGNEYGGGSISMMGGQGGGRGRGRELSDVDMYSRSGNNQSYNRGGFASNFGRGMKRKGIQANKAAVKKQKLAAAEKALKAAAAKAANQANNGGTKITSSTGQDQELKDEDFTKDAYEPDAYECFDKNEGKKKTDTEDEEEKKKLEARREKQRRRREKNTEKYGEDYRNAFTCSLCKFRTTEEQEIEAHLETPYHKETLEFIGKNIQFEKGAADFLHASMVNKNKKIAARKQLQQQEQKEPAQKLSKDVLMGVASDDQMKKVEAVQCAVCNTYIPFLFHSVQQHLKSNEHTNSKKNYHDQVRRESLLTASSMLNNPTVKAKFDLFLKGENPFENPQEQQQQQQQEEQQQQELEQQEEEEEEKQELEEKQADEPNDQALEQEENQTELEEEASEPADQ